MSKTFSIAGRKQPVLTSPQLAHSLSKGAMVVSGNPDAGTVLVVDRHPTYEGDKVRVHYIDGAGDGELVDMNAVVYRVVGCASGPVGCR